MKKNNAKPMRPIKLRKRTEELLNKNPVAIKKIPPRDVRNLLEDLQIYQIELEKHSNALQKAHENLIESKEQYRSLLANIPVGVFRSTPQGKLIATNLALIRMLGYESEEEVLKIPPVNLYVDPARGKELIEQLRIKGSLTDFEIQLRHRDGSNIWAAFSIHPVEDNQGNLIYLDGIICNITEHKQAEEGLNRKITELNSFINNLPDMAWLKDANSRFIAVNRAFSESVGMDPESLINQTCEVCFGKEEAKKFKKDDQKIMKSRRKLTIEEKITDSQKNEIWLETIKSPIMDESGKIAGTVGIARDITERKRWEKAQQKAHDELERQVEKRTKELEIKTNNLEEVNTALKVLLRKREKDKTEIGNNVLTNVKELIEPYFKKMGKTELDDRQKAFLSIIESNLNEVTTPFTRKMSMKYLDLTPKEIQIANLIRHGNSTRKIAKLINISPRTVDTHRKNIRKKIGIDKKKANIRSHLSSLY